MQRIRDQRPFATARRGFTLFELVISALLLGTVTMAAAPLLHWADRERVHAADERLAWQEAANVLEGFAAQHARGELTDDVISQQQLSDAVQQQLPEGELHIDVYPEAGPPVARRVTVGVTWDRGESKRSAPVRLTAWFYDAGGTTP